MALKINRLQPVVGLGGGFPVNPYMRACTHTHTRVRRLIGNAPPSPTTPICPTTDTTAVKTCAQRNGGAGFRTMTYDLAITIAQAAISVALLVFLWRHRPVNDRRSGAED